LKRLFRSLLAVLGVLVIACIALGGIAYGQGWRAYVIHTGSMTPNIDSGSLVIDKPAGPVHVGEVITFAKAPGVNTTHRVAAITSSGIKTRGDANPSDDFGYVTKSQVKGRVTAAIAYAGFVVEFCSHWQGVLGLVLLMTSVYFAWTIFLNNDNRQTEGAPS
jgi:signal peptidase I